jgi:hypothetical protein
VERCVSSQIEREVQTSQIYKVATEALTFFTPIFPYQKLHPTLNLPLIHNLSEHILITYTRSADIDSTIQHKGIQKTVLRKSQRINGGTPISY